MGRRFPILALAFVLASPMASLPAFAVAKKPAKAKVAPGKAKASKAKSSKAQASKAKAKASKQKPQKPKKYNLRAAVREYFQATRERRDVLEKEIAAHATGTQVAKEISAIEPVRARKVPESRRETRPIGSGSYLILLPPNYTHKRAWPLHIALHGKGEHQNSGRMCDDYWQGLPPKTGMILACPNLPGGDWKSPVGERLVLAVRRDVLASFNVKADMVTLGGFSAGAIGTWALGARYPDLFAAIVPRSGRGPGDDDLLRNLSGVPVYAMHGTADKNIPVSATRDVVRSLRKEGLFAKGSVYKERRGVAHDFGADLNRSVVQWLKSKKRPSPRQAGRLDLTVLPDRAEDVAWFVKVDSSARQRLRVTVAQDNVVNVRLSEPGRVSRVTVLLNRQVVDPSRPVTLVVNGRTMRVPADDDAALLLATYDESLDLRRSFSNRFVVGREQIADLPPDRTLETAGR